MRWLNAVCRIYGGTRAHTDRVRAFDYGSVGNDQPVEQISERAIRHSGPREQCARVDGCMGNVEQFPWRLFLRQTYVRRGKSRDEELERPGVLQRTEPSFFDPTAVRYKPVQRE